MINITNMYTHDTHIVYHHFLVSVSIGVGRRVTKGGGVSQGGGTKDCRLDYSGGGIRHWTCYSKWSFDESGGSNRSGSSISHGGGNSNWSLDQSGGGNGSGSSISRGSSISHGSGNSNWSPDGDLVCVSVRGGKRGGDCRLDYCWSGGVSYRGSCDCRSSISYWGGCDCRGGSVCREGGGGSVCCDGGSAEIASRCGSEEERQKNL
jgi:hypothetical protein